jgi:hypothetical protein
MYISNDDAPTGVTMCTTTPTCTGTTVNGGLPQIWGFPQNKWSKRHPHHCLQWGLWHPWAPPSMVASSPASPTRPPSPPRRGLPHPTGQAICHREAVVRQHHHWSDPFASTRKTTNNEGRSDRVAGTSHSKSRSMSFVHSDASASRSLIDALIIDWCTHEFFFAYAWPFPIYTWRRNIAAVLGVF